MLNKEQAIALAETSWWKEVSALDFARFQTNEPRLCSSFGDYQLAVEETLGHPFWTHQFVTQREYLLSKINEDFEPTDENLLALLPEQYRHLATG